MRQNVFRRWLILFIMVPLLLCLLALFVVLNIISTNYTDQAAAARVGWLGYRPELIFAGDSRAERGFDPAVAERELGWRAGKAVNIAVGGADPSQLVQIVRAYPEHFSQSIMILSVSPFHVNDGIKRGAYYSHATMASMNPLRLMIEFLPDNPSMLLNYATEEFRRLFIERPEIREIPNVRIDPRFRVEIDVDRFNGTSEEFNLGMPNLGSGWFVDWRTDGPRKKVLERALRELNDSVFILGVVHAPYAPTYLSAAEGEGIPDADSIREFDTIMSEIAKQVGFTYLSYAFEDDWTDKEFSDTSHLNRNGAAHFTARVVKDFHLFE